MLDAIRSFFDRRLSGAAAPDEETRLRRAAAALLIEVARIDRTLDATELAAVHAALRDKFGIDAAEAAEIAQLAEAEMATAGDYYQFTSLINRGFTQPQKIALVERLWTIAYADATLTAHELHVLRKIAGLLHVTEPEYIAAKLRAKAAAGID